MQALSHFDATKKRTVICVISLVPRLLCGGEGKRAWYTLRMRQVPLVICILLRYTKIMVNFCLLTLYSYTPCGTHTSDFEVKNNITLTVTVCIASFEVIGEVQRERLHQSRAKALSWNGRTRGQFLQVKSQVPSSLPHHCPLSGRQLLYERSRCPC